MEPKKPKPALSTESFELVTEAPANGIGGQPLYSHHEHPSPQETEVDSARNAPKTTGSKSV